MDSCPDCGCGTSNGVCSNCQEELYIIENQSEYIIEPLSDDFSRRARQQQEYIREQGKALKQIKGE